MNITRRAVLSWALAAAAFALAVHYPKEILFILVWEDGGADVYYRNYALAMILIAGLAVFLNFARILAGFGVAGPLAFALVKILMQLNFATFNTELVLCAVFSALLWLHLLLEPEVRLPRGRAGRIAWILYFVIFLYPLCHTYATPW